MGAKSDPQGANSLRVKMVEARGVEPLSETSSAKASTCVVCDQSLKHQQLANSVRHSISLFIFREKPGNPTFHLAL